MRRRELIALLGAASAWPLGAVAQGSGQRPFVGILVAASAEEGARFATGFSQGMQELGYVEGRNIDLMYRYGEGDIGRLPRIAEQMLQLHPAVMVAGPTVAALAVKQVTSTVPIVCPTMTDPIGVGLVASYQRPGGQVTGELLNLETLPGKQLEVGREIVASATRIGVLINGGNLSNAASRRSIEAAAATLPVRLVPVEVRRADELDDAFQALARERVELVIVLQDAMFISERVRLAALARAARLPTMYGFRDHVEAGGLISYGFNIRENFRRAAAFVDKILKGAKPGELPVELPTRLEMVVNLKTAKALGLEIPESFLLRADEVIE